MSNKRISVSLFLKVTDVLSRGTISIEELASLIRNGQLPRLPYLDLLSETEKARLANAGGNKTEYDRIKRTLPAVTIHAVFPGERQTGKESELTGVMMFDFDHVQNADELVEQAKTIEGVILATRSLSGEGVHIIIRYTPVQKEYFPYFYTSTQQYLESCLGVKADNCKDLPRLMIINHDLNVYFNPDVQPMDLSNVIWLYENPTSLDELSDEDEYERLSNYLDVASPNLNWIPGNRNNTLFCLSCFLNRAGFSVEDVVKICSERYVQPDFTVDEITTTIRGVFERNKEEHGKGSKVQKSTINNDDDDDDFSPLSPLPIKEHLYLLPKFYQRLINPDDSPQKQSLLFLAITTALGPIMHNVRFWDGEGQEVYAINNVMVVGPSASGKSAIRIGEEIFQYYIDYVFQKEKPVIEEQKERHREWKECMKKEQKTEEDCNCGEEPVVSAEKQLLISSASSNAYLKEALKNNGDKAALLFDEELDCSSDNNRQDYGHNSGDFRKIAEQKTISSGTLCHGGIRVRKPKMAILVSGTYAQPGRFFVNKEDGLFSRFEYYCIDSGVEWVNHEVYDEQRIQEQLSKKSELRSYTQSISNYFDGRHQIYMITPSQNEKLNAFFEKKSHEIALDADDSKRAYLFRLYNHLAIYATILSSMINCENKTRGIEKYMEIDGEIVEVDFFYLNDDMVDFVLTLAPSFLQHAYATLDKIPDKKKEEKDNGNTGIRAKKLYEKLPNAFTWKKAKEIAKEVNVPDSSLKRYRTYWVTEGLLIKEKHGSYRKTDKGISAS